MLECDVKKVTSIMLNDIRALLENSWILYYDDEIKTRLQKKLDDKLAQAKREARES